MRIPSWLAIFGATLPLLLTACLNSGETSTHVGRLQEATPQPDRTDCAQIFGTAFRSVEERNWYAQNCSRWPLVGVPPGAPIQQQGGSNATVQQSPECIAMRGRPYTSDEQRRWYLANCLGGGDPANPGTTAAGQNIRTNCDEIRGTPYRSDAERDWFLKNCPPGSGTTNPAQPQANRANCDAIRGTPYQSDAERSWYLANCGGSTPNTAQAPNTQPPTTFQPAPAPAPNRGNQGRGNGRD